MTSNNSFELFAAVPTVGPGNLEGIGNLDGDGLSTFDPAADGALGLATSGCGG